MSLIDPTQAYFYAPKWKKMELAAEEDIKEGRVSESYAEYETDRLFADLKKGRAPLLFTSILKHNNA